MRDTRFAGDPGNKRRRDAKMIKIPIRMIPYIIYIWIISLYQMNTERVKQLLAKKKQEEAKKLNIKKETTTNVSKKEQRVKRSTLSALRSAKSQLKKKH